MSVKINIPYLFQHLASGVNAVDVNGSTVGECLRELVERLPQFKELIFDKNGKLLGYIDVYINEESAYPDELAKPVNDGDELHIVNIIAGG